MQAQASAAHRRSSAAADVGKESHENENDRQAGEAHVPPSKAVRCNHGPGVIFWLLKCVCPCVKCLDGAFPLFIVQPYLLKVPLHILRNDLSPKGLGRVIVCYLRYTPLTWKHVENALGYNLAYTLMTIFSENEKLGNRTSEAGFGFIQRSYQHQSCRLTFYSYDKRVSPWFRPVVVG